VDKPGSGSCAKPGFGISGAETSNYTNTKLVKIFQKLPDLYNLYRIKNSFPVRYDCAMSYCTGLSSFIQVDTAELSKASQ
jgi:hypothetical protein